MDMKMDRLFFLVCLFGSTNGEIMMSLPTSLQASIDTIQEKRPDTITVTKTMCLSDSIATVTLLSLPSTVIPDGLPSMTNSATSMLSLGPSQNPRSSALTSEDELQTQREQLESIDDGMSIDTNCFDKHLVQSYPPMEDVPSLETSLQDTLISTVHKVHGSSGSLVSVGPSFSPSFITGGIHGVHTSIYGDLTSDTMSQSLSASTIVLTSQILQTGAPAAFMEEQCVCRCYEDEETVMQRVKKFVVEIKTNLTIVKNSTSRYLRQFNSTPDPRPSATSVGLAGIALCCISIGLLVVFDCIGCVQWCLKKKRALDLHEDR